MRKTLRLENGYLEECIVHFSLYQKSLIITKTTPIKFVTFNKSMK